MKFERCKYNPIIKASNFIPCNDKLKVLLSFNPGVTTYKGDVVLIARVAVLAKENKENTIGVPIYNPNTGDIDIKEFDKKDSSCDFSDPRLIRRGNDLYLTTLSYFALLTSKDGIHFKIKNKAFMIGDNDYESFGIEDPRITKINDYYYINYSGVSKDGICTMLARTKDFESVEKLGPIFMPDNKDVVIFPKKINKKYVAISRPESAYFKKPNMWMSYSKDLLSWGEHRIFLRLRENHFDSSRLGASCVPFVVKEGWLLIYHGATKNNVYTLGACLLDKNDPSIVLKRTKEPIMVPLTDYERNGFMPNVVFSCGCIKKGNNLYIYYGACDESICLASTKISNILDLLNNEEQCEK